MKPIRNSVMVILVGCISLLLSACGSVSETSVVVTLTPTTIVATPQAMTPIPSISPEVTTPIATADTPPEEEFTSTPSISSEVTAPIATDTPTPTPTPQLSDGWIPLNTEEQQFVRDFTTVHANLTTAVEELRLFLMYGMYGGEDDADLRGRTRSTVDSLQRAIDRIRALPASDRFVEAWQPYLGILDDLESIGESVRNALPETGSIPPLLENAGISLEMLVDEFEAAGESITLMTQMPLATNDSGLTYSAGGLQIRVDEQSGVSTTIGAAPPAGSIDGPNGTRIWVEDAPPPDFEEPQPFQLFQANHDGSNKHVLLSDETFYYQAEQITQMIYNFAPKNLVLSADGREIFFHVGSCCSPSIGFSSFFALDLASEELRRVAFDGVNSPGWISPDGEQALIKVQGWTPDGYRSFPYLLIGKSVNVELGEGINTVTWLSDGRIAIARENQLVLLRADGSEDRVLANLSPQSFITEMAIAPNQQMIAVLVREGTPESGGAMSLWFVAMEGGIPQRLADVPSDAVDLRWR